MKKPCTDRKSLIQILIVEDHPIFRMGLTDLIHQENDLAVCGAAEDVKSACHAVKELQPDLVIIDLSLKKSSGFELLCRLHDGYKQLPVLVLSMHDEQIHAERCLCAGARGYINKKEASESVIKAVRQILKGNIFLSENMTATVLKKFQSSPSNLSAYSLKSLTSRELEVFYLLGKGMISADIAKRLNLSAKTIGSHKERIKEKLGLKNSAELVRYAVLWVEKEGEQESAFL